MTTVARIRSNLLKTSAAVLVLLVGQAAGQIVSTEGLTHYQVLQRTDSDRASVSFSGTTAARVQGRLEARVLRQGLIGEVIAWRACGQAGAGTFRARLMNLPVGGPYEIVLRVVADGGKVVDRGSIRQVLVGDLWILGGQSNMEGCGILKRGAVKPHPEVHVFDMADRWLVAEEPLHWKHESVDRVHSGPPGEKLEKRRRETRKHRWRGGGLGLPFAREMAERTGVPVGLLPCAQGGSSMDQWNPALKDKGGASLYGAMFRRCQACGGRVRGMLWYQGETDALHEQSDAFPDKFKALVAAVRRDLGQPDMPFYYVQLGRYLFLEKERHWTAVREAQLRCEAEIPPPVGMVTAVDQPLVDAIHVRTRGLRVVGERLALLAWRDLTGKKDVFRGPRPATIVARGGYPKRVIITFTGVNGRLRCAGRLAGFSIRDRDGKDLRMVFDQALDPDQSDRVVLECQVTWRYAPFPEEAYLYYGWGNDPVCNLEDEMGLAAPAFGPLRLPKAK